MTRLFVPPMTRVDSTYRGKPTHRYVDGRGDDIPGVTSIIDQGIPKPALINWASKVTAEYAVDHWNDLAELPTSARLEELKGARWKTSREAMAKGTAVHALAELVVHGEPVDVPAELEGYVQAYIQFLDDFEAEPVAVEIAVVNYSIGYAGTLDVILEIDGARWLVDVKTGKAIYGEAALQVAAYANAEAYVGADGIERPMIPVDRLGAIHVRADGYTFHPLPDDPSVFLNFRYAAAVSRLVKALPTYVGAPLEAPAREAS